MLGQMWGSYEVWSPQRLPASLVYSYYLHTPVSFRFPVLEESLPQSHLLPLSF